VIDVLPQNAGTGFYEGITGVITQPLEGAKNDGTLGFLKGLGKGSMGLVAKPGSGMLTMYFLNPLF